MRQSLEDVILHTIRIELQLQRDVFGPPRVLLQTLRFALSASIQLIHQNRCRKLRYIRVSELPFPFDEILQLRAMVSVPNLRWTC